MARAGKLKVYRTAIGFHDAYVAAASKKAALAAWGSDRDLFARGIAELVDDPALTKAPLADPGRVIRVSRGTAAEQIAALPPDKARKTSPKPASGDRPARPPSRKPLDTAERALADATTRIAAEAKAIAREEADLARRKRAMEKAHAAETAELEAAADRARRDYEKALRGWEG